MKERIASITGIFASIAAAACCLGPVVLAAIGMTSVGLTAYAEWLRPYLLGVSLAALTLSYGYAYGSGAACPGKGYCDIRRRTNRVLFWVLAVAFVFGFGSPYLFALFGF